jgi:hypothetical protein
VEHVQAQFNIFGDSRINLSVEALAGAAGQAHGDHVALFGQSMDGLSQISAQIAVAAADNNHSSRALAGDSSGQEEY